MIEGHVHTSRHYATHNRPVSEPVHPTFYQTTNSRQSANTLAGIVQLITLTIHPRGLKVLRNRTGSVHENISAQYERHEGQQRK